MINKTCPCCESRKIEVLYKRMRDKEFLKPGEFCLLKCKRCELEFAEPILTEKQLEEYYPKAEYYSYHNYNPLAIKYHKISAYYYSGKNLLFNILFFIFKPLFYTYYLEPGKSILEIGCGNGMKLNIYQKYGMKTSGLEPYMPKIDKKAKELGILKTTVKKAPYEKNSFDYIILKEVLEHVPDQKVVLKAIHHWLKPNGKLIITIPNTKGIWNKIFKENWYGYDIPRHIYNYNPKNIKFFLNKLGFKINKIRTYDMPYMFDGSLKFYFTNKTGKKEHPIIFSNLMKILSVPLSLVISIMKKGSLIEIICEKRN